MLSSPLSSREVDERQENLFSAAALSLALHLLFSSFCAREPEHKPILKPYEMASCYLCKGQQRIQEHPAKTTHIYTDSLWINFHLTSPHSTFILIPPSILPSAFFLTFFLSSSLSFSLFLSSSVCPACQAPLGLFGEKQKHSF